MAGMKYYVVSEDELVKLQVAIEQEAYVAGIGNNVSHAYESRRKAETACRAREVKECDIFYDIWELVEKDK